MDDPILYASTVIALIGIPVISNLLSKIKLKYIFIPTVLSLGISFPMFLLLVIVQQSDMFPYLFYISMSLWTGGFFSIFINLYVYRKKKKTLLKDVQKEI
ncbi:hypothetical protein [Mariniplasma anaerobium]|uniref:Uncharacterized protein n=1 Tax=Mariniplasma anaerobium TaxID=2735436 RepID=A0A7U9TI27_9MOLU|nr:hypothetical protein [Mariniplasma anaerobium]BCR35604.1 hypothetical protein MPAN_004970 [Mariniplasma anaerobium]